MNESIVNAGIELTIKVIRCKSGDYVGSVKEIPIVVQADTLEHLNTELVMCLADCIIHDSPKTVPHNIIKVSA